MAWNPVSDFTPSSGAVAALSNPGSISNGFTDVSGNYWSVDSSNFLHSIANTSAAQWNTGLLARLGASDLMLNNQTIVRFTAIAGEAICFMSRVTITGGNSAGYIGVQNQINNTINIYPVVNGALGTILANGNLTLTAGTDYDATLTTYQVTPTTTSVILSFANTSGTVLGSLSINDSTSALQNVVGGQGFFTISASSGSTPITIKRIRTYSVAGFALSTDFTPSGGTSTSIGNGFTDVSGNSWSIDSSNVLHSVDNTNASPWNAGLLARLGSGDLIVDSQVVTRFTCTAQQSNFVMSRVSVSGGNTIGYMAGYTQSSGVLLIYSSVAGTLSSTLATTSAALSLGFDYDLTLTTFQLSPSSTILSATIQDTSGNVLALVSTSDSNGSLQNASGGQGIFSIALSSSATPASFKRLRTFTNIGSATSYVISLPNTALTGIPVTGTIQLKGGPALTSSITVSLNDTSSGVFSPSTITLPSNSGPVGFMYTPSVAGTRIVSFSHTGGNAGMAGDGTQNVIVNLAVVVKTNDAACVMSPYNWSVGTSGVGTSQTWNTGAYARFYFKGCTTVNLLLDNAVSGAQWRYRLDNGPLSNQQSISASASISIPDTGSHCITVWLDVMPGTGRWNGTNYLGVQGLYLGAGGSADPVHVVRGSKYLLVYADSIGEGAFANQGSDGVVFDYSYFLGEALVNHGFEYGIVACTGQGYTLAGAAGGSVPPLFTIGSDSNSTWNKPSSSSTRLDTNGNLSPPPTIVFDAIGTNDSSHAGNSLSPTLSAQIQAFYQALRQAASSALLIKQIPFGGFCRSDITTAIAAYKASSSDGNIVLSDLNIDSRMGSSGNQYCLLGSGNGGLHPNIWGHANIGTLVLDRVLSSYLGAPLPPTPIGPAHAVAKRAFKYNSTYYNQQDFIFDPNFTLLIADTRYSDFFLRISS